MTDLTVAFFIALGGAVVLIISFIAMKFWYDRHPNANYKQPRKILTGVFIAYGVLAGLYFLMR